MLDLTQDVRALTAAIVDIESVSGAEQALADAVERALRALPHLKVRQDGQTRRRPHRASAAPSGC